MSDEIYPLERHDALVRWWAARMAPKLRIPIEDTEEYADGWLGLCNAARKFDPSRGWRFSTYASHAIRNRIIQSREAANAVRRGGSGQHRNVELTYTIQLTGDHPVRYSCSVEVREEAERLLSKVAPHMAELIRRAVAGESFCDIAKSLRCDRSRVRRIVSIGIELMRRGEIA